jgi:uncharacterized protein (TIGR02145 family)
VEGTTREHYGKSKAQFCDSRDGKKYVYVKIGTQTWMAENLNYNASGSKCYDNSEANCTIYGRLYNWATAMALPSNCNSNSCPSQINAKHKGICPTGWHILSDAEWNVLMTAVGGSSTAGTKLKAKSGWGGGNGTDAYGFSALPGGNGSSNGNFYDVGSRGYWWSATEYGAGYAYGRGMDYGYEDVYYDRNYKSLLFSVRCLQD